MFALIKRCKKLVLPIDLQLELFDKMITPILLYGCEIWCPASTDLACKLQLRYYKIILKLNKTTPTNMIYGETGQFPLAIQAKTRLLCFWYNLVNSNNNDKISSALYRYLHQSYNKPDGYRSAYLSYVESMLNDLGMSGVWMNQFRINNSLQWFKTKVKRCMQDQFIQGWMAEINTKEIYYNYRLYKHVFKREDYLTTLPTGLMYSFLRFRTLNHKLPVQKGRSNNIPRSERLCTKCNNEDIGDEFHYIMKCSFFSDSRKQLIPCTFWKYPNVIKFCNLLSSNHRHVVIKLVHFIKIIISEFS